MKFSAFSGKLVILLNKQNKELKVVVGAKSFYSNWKTASAANLCANLVCDLHIINIMISLSRGIS